MGANAEQAFQNEQTEESRFVSCFGQVLEGSITIIFKTTPRAGPSSCAFTAVRNLHT